MKSLIYLCIFLAVGFVSAERFRITDLIKKKINEAEQTCADFHKVSRAALDAFNYFQGYPTYEEVGCLVKCVYKGINALREDGTVNTDVILNTFSQEAKPIHEELVKGCAMAAKDEDSCKTVFNFDKCYTLAIEHKYDSIDCLVRDCSIKGKDIIN